MPKDLKGYQATRKPVGPEALNAFGVEEKPEKDLSRGGTPIECILSLSVFKDTDLVTTRPFGFI